MNPKADDSREVPIEAIAQTAVNLVYANSVGLVATAFDLCLNFGQILQRGDKLVTEPHTSVVMSWEHAKALRDFLHKNIEEHERAFGPLYYNKKGQE